MYPEIEYWSNAADEMLPLELVISDKGVAVLKLRAMRNMKDVPAVGLFQAQIVEQGFKFIVDTMRTREFLNLPNPTAATEGEVARRLIVREQGKPEMVKIASGNTSRAPAFLTAENLIKTLISEVQKNPVYALAIEVTGLSTALQKGEALEAIIDVANRGSQPIRIPSHEGWAAKSVAVTMEALRNDIPMESLGARHQKFEKIATSDVKSVQAGGLSEKVILLQPGEKGQFLISKRVEWDDGSYDVRFIMELPFENAGKQEIMRCELLSKSVIITIGKR